MQQQQSRPFQTPRVQHVKLMHNKKPTKCSWHVDCESNALDAVYATAEFGTNLQQCALTPLLLEIQDAASDKNKISHKAATDLIERHQPLVAKETKAVFLPNFVRKIIQTCFLPAKATTRTIDPIAHILHKAWPMRCSVRNFSDIVSMYILESDEVYLFLLQILHASMIGVYSSNVKANMQLRLLMYRHYVHSPITREHLSQWVKNNNHLLLFIAIKEYMVFAIQTTPGISRVLCDVYNWRAFISDVTKQGNAVRTALNKHVGCPVKMFQAALQALSTSRCFKCPAALSNHSKVAEQLITVVRQCYLPHEDIYKYPLRTLIYRKIEPLVRQNVSFLTIATAFGIDEKLATFLNDAIHSGADNNSLKALKKHHMTDIVKSVVVHELMHAWLLCFQLQTTDLPAHITRMQRECTVKPVKHFVCICTCCRQLREFVVDQKTAGGNAWARGHQKVLFDDNTGDIFCGRRVEKSSTLKCAPAKSSSATISRSFWKSQQTHMCGYSPLLRIKLLGKMLFLFGKMYVLCPSCMCVMQVRESQYFGDCMRCTHCTYKHNIPADSLCFHCHKSSEDQSTMSTVALCTNIVHVCQTCKRPWMEVDRVTEKFTVAVAQQAIDERWSMNRALAYCACI